MKITNVEHFLTTDVRSNATDEALARPKPFRPSLQPRLDGLDGSVRDF